jgi:hypothetical protein
MNITNDYERRVLRGALNLYRRHLEKRVHATDRRGWTPEPGRQDGNRLRIKTVDALIERWQLMPKA